MSKHLSDAIYFLQQASRALESHVDQAPTPRSYQRGQELAGATRKVMRATRALESRDGQKARAAA